MFAIRELERNDLKEINKWRYDTGLIDCLGAAYRYICMEIDEKWYDSYIQNRAHNVRCAITDDGMLIGMVSLVNINDINRTAVFNIMIGKASDQNNGAGSFATKKMLEHAFYNLNLNRIELSVLSDNKRAIHMYEKCGFVKEGTKRACVYKNGQYKDMHIYSVLKEEFMH